MPLMHRCLQLGSGLICQEETYCGDGAVQGPRRVEEKGQEKRQKKDKGRGELRRMNWEERAEKDRWKSEEK